MPRKLNIAGVVVLLFVGTVCVLWAGLNLPPPLWILDYGLQPGCKPTGKVVKAEGVEFVMIGPGICRIGSDYILRHPTNKAWRSIGFTKGDVLGRMCQPVGLSWGKAMKPSVEMPVHWCEFPGGFGIAKTEITESEYARFDAIWTGIGPSKKPELGETWEEARKYCVWLSKKSGLDIRLPSESEWECACRAGTETEYANGNSTSHLGEIAWYEKNSPDGSRGVATRKPNAWGLFDMEGNVSEWCQDRWHDFYFMARKVNQKGGSIANAMMDRAPDDGSVWETGSTSLRVMRGGSWFDPAEVCRCAFRSAGTPSAIYGIVGIRPALSLRPDR